MIPRTSFRRVAAGALLLALVLAACSSTQLGSGELGALVPQLLGIAILAWIVILIL